MKAIVYHKYGPPDVLELTEVEKPIPEDNQVLVKIHAASVNYGNLVLLKGEPFLARFAFGLLKPKYSIPGGDIAGRVEAVGKDVKQFQPGDEVFGDLSRCGWGGFAEYVSVPENALALKPANLSFEEAAAVPMAAVTALQALRDKGKIQPGQKILINGASGGVGTFAVQIAKSFGAEVTAVCSTRNLTIVRSIGADHAIDYTKEDFTRKAESYDLILAANGYQPISAYKRLLSPNGNYVMVGGSGAQMFQAMAFGPWISMAGSKKMGNILQRQNQKDLVFMKELLESGKVKPVIDRSYKLSEVPEAFRYFAEGHSQGKVVITM
ncbi:NAD(P)-dependent alcohol dehydrogenase [Fictibacillus sp. WQ 8-8]|uniref:NAD(P)-dependent alcohol dehydrogenase n=1 Tax=unclassified Fictibacillus TaxID=2644029 RepID=UPI0007865215|nr:MULTISPECIES: NAD(P)-dependent alcohol dehydrogenase [unclassified Fictibacillus]MCQ6268153.1 NAD(P)-dependent alcohol dehydrogenase [Fictibacillus sp. WQ 8-8]